MTSTGERDFDTLVSASAGPGSSESVEPTGSRLDDWWDARSEPARRIARWVAPAIVVVIAAVTRLWNLGHPATLVFD